jgi:CheY-like chemotaxis protein
MRLSPHGMRASSCRGEGFGGVQAYDSLRASWRDGSRDARSGSDHAGADGTIGRRYAPVWAMCQCYAVCNISRGWEPTVRDGPILIVEDDPTIRHLLCSLIEDEGHDVVAVDNGIDAVSAASRHHPAAILLDLNLPRLDGTGVLSALRRDGISVPVLLVTADPRGQRLGMAEGVTGHVPKPFDLDDLLLALHMTLTGVVGNRADGHSPADA